MSKPASAEKKVLVRHRKARHDYEIESTWEAGMALLGSEVKSLRESHAQISDAYAELRKNEVWLINAKIEPYPWANQFNHEPTRPRKLLLNRQEIHRIGVKMRDTGYTIVPLEIYVKNGKIKIEIALARGKKQFEKRDSKRAAEAQREIEAAGSRKR
jgi:SsrA-binding protein